MNDDMQAQKTQNAQNADAEIEFSEADVVDEGEANHEGVAINHLTELGNRAVNLKLIGGHGFHRGQYELLREGKFLLMTPIEAQQYLEALIAAAEASA